MGETVHIIPVGFDYERLLLPITQGELDADRVILLHSPREEEKNANQELAAGMVEKLDYTFKTVLGKSVKIDTPVDSTDDIYDYRKVYSIAYDMIETEVTEGNDVWINISSMPRTVAFAFATAANSIIVENPDVRNRIHTYYVSPQEYLITDMIEELENELDFLEKLRDGEDVDIEDRIDTLQELMAEVENSGTTKGAKQMNGGLHVEFPTVPSSDLRDFEKRILHCLARVGTTESTTELAEKLATEQGEDPEDQSFKSKVQYNVKQLEKDGYINRHPGERENSYRTSLSTMGKLWVDTHPENKSRPKPFDQ